MKAFKVGQTVSWKWLGREINGVVKQVYLRSVSKNIKGSTIKRNGSEENPAYLVESGAGNIALKLHSELKELRKTKQLKPKMFDD